MNKNLEGNVAMFVSKTFSGLNMNALKFLIPVWIGPLTCLTLRVTFAAIVFWIFDLFVKHDSPTTGRQKLYLFLTGALGISGYMLTYLMGLKYTTPVSCSIIMAVIPMWVLILSFFFFREKITRMKGLGLIVGFLGALLSMVSKKDPAMASDPMLGDMLTLLSTIFYAFYLIITQSLLKDISVFIVLKWTFLGAAFSSVIANLIGGWDTTLFEAPVHWLPLALLAFVLIFPTVISYLLLPLGLKYLDATIVAMYGYWVIAVTTIVALIAGQDRFDWINVFSIILLCVGLYMVEVAENRHSKVHKHQIKGT